MGKERKMSGSSTRDALLLNGILITTLIVAMLLATIPISGATSAYTGTSSAVSMPEQAPLNPAFTDYQSQMINTGLVPATVNLSDIQEPAMFQGFADEPLSAVSGGSSLGSLSASRRRGMDR